MSTLASPFQLPDRLATKAAPALVGRDEAHFRAVAAALGVAVQDASDRLVRARRAPAGSGQKALDRDLEVHQLSRRLGILQRYGVDACLGRMTLDGHAEPVYIGRIGLSNTQGERLLVDWRSPAAEPFFAATRAHPLGLLSRRRYRWKRGRVTDYWDERLDPAAPDEGVALDDESAFLAMLGESRSTRMRDVLGTIQSDQDAIVRADAQGALVVDGGPGTGKTVVALHRAAYLLYADPRISRSGRGALLIGPNEGYLAYVEDVLPSLGEEGVRTCTLRELVPEGANAISEPNESVAALKASLSLVAAVERAVDLYEIAPTAGMTVETEWADVWLDPADWADAFGAAEPGTTHNDARDQVWDALLDLLVDAHEDVELPAELVRRALAQNPDLRRAFARAWPLLDPAGVVADLWSSAAYLARCAPQLDADEVRALQRVRPRAWTTADLPLLDAARARIGDPDASRRRRQRDAEVDRERDIRQDVIDNLIEADDDHEGLVQMFRAPFFSDTLIEDSGDPDPFALRVATYAHVVVDEAQELTDAEWRMVLRRCPSRSLTIVGDRAQARRGFSEPWTERLGRVGIEHARVASLSVNYRTPQEVMSEAAPVIRAVLPDANVPTSVRRSGIPVEHGDPGQLDGVLRDWLAGAEDGVASVIATGPVESSVLEESGRIRLLTPDKSKGLEFDLVVLVDPSGFGDGVLGAVDRYVSMTRATQRLVILEKGRRYQEPGA